MVKTGQPVSTDRKLICPAFEALVGCQHPLVNAVFAANKAFAAYGNHRLFH